MDDVRILLDPDISADQLFDFYQRNDICEVGFGKEIASRVLEHSDVIAGAFRARQLVGIARACFDGVSASIMELSLDLSLQGESSTHNNGSLVEGDPRGVGRRLGEALMADLRAKECTFISVYLVADCEEDFYRSIGFEENVGHKVFYVDERPYV